jgi:glucose-1-phosphate thymidylyltransferase
MKGIILAGGRGQRLGELTRGVSKQLLSVYKQPMVYYPLKTLIDMGIKDVLIIVSSKDQYSIFFNYLGYGQRFGVNITYKIQENPNGLAEAFILGESFIGDDDVTLILGDNVFLTTTEFVTQPNTIFTYKVKDPSAYGVVKCDHEGNIEQLVEKPTSFISNDAVVGLYVFTNLAVKLAKTVKPSYRGELEIVDLIRAMNYEEGVNVSNFNGVWFDCGTHDDLLECAEFVRALDKRTNSDIFLKEIIHGKNGQ